MHDSLLQDLALIMLVAGMTTVVFRLLRQPVVLGYILAGVIVGPHTGPFPLIQEEATIETLGQIGVILLMFSLGLHFSLRQLAKVGGTAGVAGLLEIPAMGALGFTLGRIFGWPTFDCIFLGAIIAISSTTIIVKAFEDLRVTKERFAQVTFGILIVEDVAAIIILALLSGAAATGTLAVAPALDTITQLAVFLAAVLLAGLIFVPRLLRYLSRFRSNEMLLVTLLGLCFGVSLLALKLGFSVALGAFLIGAVVAESREGPRAAELIEPVRDMFSAVFFVAVGTLINLQSLAANVLPIVAVCVAVVFGKGVFCSLGAFLGGSEPKTAVRTGLSMTQIGEFSFIIAGLGATLGVTSDFLYPMAIAVSAVTTLTTPYLIRSSEEVISALRYLTPKFIREPVRLYAESSPLQFLHASGNPVIRKIVRRSLLQIALNLVLISGLFIAADWLERESVGWLPELPKWFGGARTVFWAIALFGALPLCVAVVRKVQAVSMIAAEMSIGDRFVPSRRYTLRAMLSSTLTVFFTLLFVLSLLVMSSAVLPPPPVLAVLLVVIGLVTTRLWGHFVRVYAQAQVALRETFERSAVDQPRSLPSALRDAEIFGIDVRTGSPAAGKLIRELEIRSRTGATIVAIERSGEAVMNPSAHEELLPGDRLLLLGSPRQMEQLEAMLSPRTANSAASET